MKLDRTHFCGPFLATRSSIGSKMIDVLHLVLIFFKYSTKVTPRGYQKYSQYNFTGGRNGHDPLAISYLDCILSHIWCINDRWNTSHDQQCAIAASIKLTVYSCSSVNTNYYGPFYSKFSQHVQKLATSIFHHKSPDYRSYYNKKRTRIE